jgi:uncharacterized protein
LKSNISSRSTEAFAVSGETPELPAGPAVRVALAALRAYKLLLSPFYTGSCRFLPSCSDYARESVMRYGVLRGSWLAATRLARCHPLCEGGYDPVPQPPADGRGALRTES